VYPQWCFALVEWGVCFELPKVLEGAGRAWILIQSIIVSFMYLFCQRVREQANQVVDRNIRCILATQLLCWFEVIQPIADKSSK
jgi:hypothetical protein